MTEADVDALLRGNGLWQGPVTVTRLKGGYLNQILLVTTGAERMILKQFLPAATGTLFPNLPDDEARALLTAFNFPFRQ